VRCPLNAQILGTLLLESPMRPSKGVAVAEVNGICVKLEWRCGNLQGRRWLRCV